MGSGGGGGGGGNDDKVASTPTKAGDSIAGKAAGTRTDSRKPKPGVRKREEERLTRAGFVSGDASYVREAPKEGERRGSIIRTGGRDPGRGVLTAKGVERAEASRQEELEVLISQRTGGQGDPRAEKRKMAIEALEERKENTLPGFLGAISRINIENQIKQLKEGTADPQFALTESGSFAPVGVTRADDDTVGGNIAPMFPDTGERDEPEPQQPIIDEEIVEETILGRGRGRGAAAKRRTRGTRVGGAGSFEEGYGVLLRNQ